MTAGSGGGCGCVGVGVVCVWGVGGWWCEGVVCGCWGGVGVGGSGRCVGVCVQYVCVCVYQESRGQQQVFRAARLGLLSN